MMRSKGKWIALAAAAALAMGFIACSDGDDYSDVGPVKASSGGGDDDSGDLETRVKKLQEALAKAQGDIAGLKANPNGGGGKVGITSVTYEADSAGAKVFDVATGKELVDENGDPVYDAWKAATAHSADKDAYVIASDTVSRYVWGDSANVVLHCVMPNDETTGWDGVNIKWAQTASSQKCKLSDFAGAAVSSSVVDETPDADGKFDITVDSGELGDEMFLVGSYMGKDEKPHDILWKVPVTKAPSIALTALAPSSPAPGKIQYKWGSMAAAADTGLTTIADCSTTPFPAKASAAKPTSTTAAKLYLVNAKAGDATDDVEDTLDSNTAKGTLTAKKPTPTDGITYQVYEGCAGNLAIDRGTITVTVGANGKADVKATAASAGKRAAGAITIKTDTAGSAAVDGVPTDATTAFDIGTKTLWCGKINAGVPADGEITGVAPSDITTVLKWSVEGKTGGNTAMAAATGVLTLDKGETGTNGELTLKVEGLDTNTAMLYQTYTIKVAAWPTLKLGIASNGGKEPGGTGNAISGVAEGDFLMSTDGGTTWALMGATGADATGGWVAPNGAATAKAASADTTSITPDTAVAIKTASGSGAPEFTIKGATPTSPATPAVLTIKANSGAAAVSSGTDGVYSITVSAAGVVTIAQTTAFVADAD